MLNFLWTCQEAYYNGTPLLSDEEFDTLAEKYNFYEVGALPTSTKNKQHLYRMYSLEKFYEEDGVDYPSEGFIITPKLDGSAISLLYMQGKLVLALTRGDGFVGEDITDKMLNSLIVPNSIYNLDTVQVTGEIVAPKDIENARNYTSGALHLKDMQEFLSRDLTFIAYGVQPFINKTFTGDMQSLQDMEFNTILDSDWDIFPQDGKVIRIDSNEIFTKRGFTNRHPKGAFAVKKRSDVAVLPTILREVTWQLGKGGKVTPVAHFDTIVIEDANISKATLHNPGFIEDFDLHIGDTILITRSGGIIPKVVGKL